MGFGASTTVGNVSVDLVQADVDGIIAGIANGKTLANVDDTLTIIDSVLDNILFDTADLQYLYSSSASAGVADLLQYSGYSAGYYLQNIEDDTSYLSSIYSNTSSTASNTGSMLSYLSAIDSNTDYLYSPSAGYGVADLLYNYLYYSGYSAGYLLYEIEANTSDMTNMQYLYSSSAGYGVADMMYYNGYTVAQLLYDIESDTGYLPYLYSSSAGYGIADLLYSSSASKSVADLLYSSSSNTVADLLESIKTAVESLAGALSGGRLQVDDQH